MRLVGRRSGRACAWLCALAISSLGLLSACEAASPDVADAKPAFDDAASAPVHYKAVLIAGDASLPVFDNATRHMHDLLIAAGLAEGEILRMSAAEGEAEPATLASVTQRIGGLHAGQGEGCFVFLTSHGSPRDGFSLARRHEFLNPGQLDRALAAGCGTRPTIVVVSSCFSGVFAQQPVTQPNRIILTAARRDRPSFGCGAGFTYTIFDQCLLGAVDGAAEWRAVYERARRCVATHEAAMQETPSKPQAYFGGAVSGIPALWRAAPDRSIHFVAGAKRFSPDDVPMYEEEREHDRAELARYAEAAGPKALALSPEGAFAWAAATPADNLTRADAERLAVQRCEWFGGPCVLYSVDDRVVAPLPSGLVPFHPPLLARSGPVEPAAVPFIRDDQRPIVAEYLKLAGPKALVLGFGQPVVTYAAARSAPAARDAALAKCRAKTSDCVLFAQDEHVVLGGLQ